MTTMIIIDLDDTLLRSDKTISDYTVDVLRKCQVAGMKIVFATARSTQASLAFLDRFMPDVFVGYGGALVLAGGEILYRFDIPADIANQIIQECLETPEVTGIHAINESIALSNNPEPDMRHYQYTDFSKELNNRYLKISLFSSNPAVAQTIASHFPMCDFLRYTGEDLYRFANRVAVKWTAIKSIADYYEFDTNTFIAFGDDVNDLEMIQKCGTGIAVKNAIPDVQSAAKYICESNNDDGVAKWIEQHILCHNGYRCFNRTSSFFFKAACFSAVSEFFAKSCFTNHSSCARAYAVTACILSRTMRSKSPFFMVCSVQSFLLSGP